MKDLEVLLEKMCQELDQVKGKWKSTKHAHGKVVEEKELWKKYAEKIEDERKSNQRGLELERKVFNKLTQIETLLKSEKQHQNIVLSHLDSFGSDLISEVRSLQTLKQTQTDKIWKLASETQTDAPDEDTSVLKILEQDNAELQDKLNKTECELQTALLQNSTLRGVILKMKSDRENLDRAKELEEEDARVSKLEASVRLIKNNFVNGQNEVCICSALQDVQKEIACLKNKNVVSNIATPRPLKPAFTRKKILNV
ncbi:myosin-10-like [Macrosteles quadrilineatus]|uniref:myosin-10-like n=1 Tax=Macrosteles quadrilineatus TaxID=74068 RepID=UPI0023E24C6C|nr:myosin-10-like [Macrosteles quadrilineatus]